MSSFIVNCQWENWTTTECNATCGNAFRTYKRKIIQIAAFGGVECTGESTMTKECQLKACPGTTDFFNTYYSKKVTIMSYKTN